MTDRSSEERSREWKPLVEVIRREMLARFSDKLSMEEIASCAYAVAALEDRQEAAPTKDTTKSICGCIMCDFHVSAAEIRDRESDASWALGAFQSSSPGVPSEATPSKENAPLKFYMPPFHAQEGEPENPYVLDASNHMIATMFWPSHSQDETRDAELETYRLMRLIPELLNKHFADSPPLATADDWNRIDATTGLPAPAPEVPIAPSKENAPNCQRCALPMTEPWHYFDISSIRTGELRKTHTALVICETCMNFWRKLNWWPAPEVQGTPTKEEQAILDRIQQRSDETAAGTGHPPGTDTIMASEEEDRVFRKFTPPPVGTPEKETPPMSTTSVCPTCKSSERRLYPDPCPTNQHTGGKCCQACDHEYPTPCVCGEICDDLFHAVPEGVQGKEPAECGECCCGEFCKYHRGEAAGRRSAITEMQEWAETWESGVCVTDTRKISAKCAELQEKTKP